MTSCETDNIYLGLWSRRLGECEPALGTVSQFGPQSIINLQNLKNQPLKQIFMYIFIIWSSIFDLGSIMWLILSQKSTQANYLRHI